MVIKPKECQDLAAFVRSRYHARTITAVVVKENEAGLHFGKVNSVVERRNDLLGDNRMTSRVLSLTNG